MPYFVFNYLDSPQSSHQSMAIKKSSQRVKVSAKKDGSGTEHLSVSSLPKQNRRSKNTPSKSKTTIRRTRVTQRTKPNTDAATHVVAESVAVYISTKSASSKLEDTSKKPPKRRRKSAEKRTQTKPQTRVKSTNILAGDVNTEAQPQPRRKRKESPRVARESQQSRDTEATGRKRSSKRRPSAVRKADGKPIDTKQTTPKSQNRSSSTKKSAKTTREAPTSSKRATPPKKATRTSAKRTPQKKIATKSKSHAQTALDVAKRKTRAKRKSKKKSAETVVHSDSPRPSMTLTHEYIIGFQGIYYKPYQLSSKDLFMSGAQQDHFLDILTRAKEKLLTEEADRASQLQENDASNLPDPLDQGTNEGVFHNQLRTRDRESQLVRKINRAIDCLKTGSYGYCEACGCEIPIRRLEARPIVTKCIDCKERDELRERQLGQ